MYIGAVVLRCNKTAIWCSKAVWRCNGMAVRRCNNDKIDVISTEWAREYLIYSSAAMQEYGGDKINKVGTKWVRKYLTYSGQHCTSTVLTRLMQLIQTEWIHEYLIFNGDKIDVIGIEWRHEYLTYSNIAI